VHGPNPAHGLDLSGMAACGAGRTSLPTRLGPPGEAGPSGEAGAIGVEVQVRQGLGLEHHGKAADVSGKESGSEAHRGRRLTARRGGGSMRWRTAVSSPEGGSAATSVSSYSTVHGGEVRSRGEIRRRTRGGGAHREATAAVMVAWLAAWSGQVELDLLY
jgi:hypothetical protein